MNSIEPEDENARRHFELGSGKFDLLFSFKTIIVSYRILWRMNFNFRQDIYLNNVTYFT